VIDIKGKGIRVQPMWGLEFELRFYIPSYLIKLTPKAKAFESNLCAGLEFKIRLYIPSYIIKLAIYEDKNN